MSGKMAKKTPSLCPKQGARLFRRTLSSRRHFCDDGKFFKAVDAWREISSDVPEINIKAYKGAGTKAGVVALGGAATLIAPQDMLVRADKGCKLANFTLAHEMAHLLEGHHENNAVIKNFQLFDHVTGNANIPPTLEELEANYVAVFWLCGPSIFDCDRKVTAADGSLRSLGRDAKQLADRAFCDVQQIRRARKLLEQQSFWEEINKMHRDRPRETL